MGHPVDNEDRYPERPRSAPVTWEEPLRINVRAPARRPASKALSAGCDRPTFPAARPRSLAAVNRRPLEVASRRVVQDAKLAIRDVYDAIVEVVTNAADRYQILQTEGRVEIEVGRQGRGRPSILRVRDFADGMSTDQMNRKLGRIGGWVSGMEGGLAVRGIRWWRRSTGGRSRCSGPWSRRNGRGSSARGHGASRATGRESAWTRSRRPRTGSWRTSTTRACPATPRGGKKGSRFQLRGYSLSPQYAQVVRGQSFKCWLTVRSEAFPEIGDGDTVEVECLTDELRADRTEVPLSPVEAQDGVLRATWSVRALEATPATGLEARVGPIGAESTIAVLASEAERYAHVIGLQFERRSYRVRGGSRRSIRLLAPVSLARSDGGEFELKLASDDFRVSGARQLVLSAALGVAVCRLTVALLDDDASPTLVVARLGDHEAETELRAAAPAGAGIVIKLEDVDHGALRYRWNRNVLEIGARHPSLKRYLGPKSEQYPGQDQLHFRVLLAEVVAEALCARRLQGNIEANPRDFEGMSWDEYYRHFARMMSEFLPKAHGLMAPGG